MKKHIQYYLHAGLNSYAILFFSQNKILGALLFVVSMFSLTAGISGLICVIFSIALVTILGFDREEIKLGLYSFNSLLLGIGFGTFYNFNYAFWFWLFASTLLCIMLSVNIKALLGKYALPTLSVPFIITFWLVLVAVNGYAGMGLMQKSSYVIFELNTNGSSHFSQLCKFFDDLNMSPYVALFFRSVSAVLFQNSILAGILISIGFFIHSRIGFSLLVIGFIVACIINHLTGTYPEGISNYHLGANFMMVSCAIGGFFLIPSWRSYLWAIVAIPFTFLLVNGFSKLLGLYNLPVFSIPFCFVTIGLLYFFMLRKKPGKLQLTALQNYSPETNLYQFLNGQERLKDFRYLRLGLPFMGAWTVSQGYEGAITHQGEWSEALDFVLKDLDNKTYQLPGIKPEDYYCFNKPILAVADGVVEEVINHIDDNVIGQVNLQQNWGNTVVIKHAEDLYSKVSHLKKNSVKVKVGDFVRQGEIIGQCGNSGRSPEPHLHFQMQTTPYIGSKTFAYPFAYFVNEQNNQLQNFEVPKEGETIQSPEINAYLKHAFNFQPGYIAKIKSDNGKHETWEVFTDSLNYNYFYCHENQSIAYFINNLNSFYFTRFYGSKQSLLYLFYQSAYKINFSTHAVNDVYATDSESFKPNLWLQDLISPFFTYIKRVYSNVSVLQSDGLEINVKAIDEILGRSKKLFDAEIKISNKGITDLELLCKNKKVKIKWETDLS
ncbi:urea transporter [Pedobacter fastidiosus]|uniref:Urea transporter n=1 Tax=Pedobacter fastidiosus TaxID=2765361 RepID=A0ABR7KLF5_9SPHI|nr:urea transporter [Pedobacter fastidiosus]MBC6108904.1 urea transporter [Pedobacter fastidiosus]